MARELKLYCDTCILYLSKIFGQSAVVRIAQDSEMTQRRTADRQVVASPLAPFFSDSAVGAVTKGVHLQRD